MLDTDMTNWHLGTMGFSYKDWVGIFYPRGLKSRNYLRHYSKIFDSVEVDSTFYGTPKSDVIQRWMNNSPEHFVFCLKMPKIITHELRLVKSTTYIQEFLDRVLLLEDKLGVVLIQLPPSFHSSNQSVLDAFLEDLPGGIRYAVEFRHRSWYTSKSAEILARYNVCWAATEYKNLPKSVPATADFQYVRFIGHHGRFDSFASVKVDVSDDLKWWQKRFIDQVTRTESFYVFFNNDFSGYAPETCNQFKQYLGLPTVMLQPPQQKRLL
jgi:uncharacterized protein YecE (DUF72 family)